MASKVYFVNIKKISDEKLPDKIEKLCCEAGIDGLINPGDAVAVKMHFGEEGAKGVVSPHYIKKIVDLIKSKEGNAFLTDTGTLYWGDRSRAPGHLRRAILNGYGYEKTGAPVVIADGLIGMDFKEVVINGEFYKNVRIASGIYYADVIVAVSHFKGHELTGFGGALKNLGMGCAPRPGKLEMHSSVAPHVSCQKCSACGSCIKYCPVDAIKFKIKGKKKFAEIDLNKCIGCGYCIAICPNKALEIGWDEGADELPKKMAEYAFGSVKQKRAGYVNFLNHITSKCDCYKDPGHPIVSDIGILASLDPVAIDAASLDLFNKEAGKDKFKEVYPSIDSRVQLTHAQKLGMGSVEYELITL